MRRVIHRLLRVRGFAFIALPTLAISIGATTAVFSIIDAVLLRPLPYEAAVASRINPAEALHSE